MLVVTPISRAKRLDPGWSREFKALYNTTRTLMAGTMLRTFEAAQEAINPQTLAALIESKAQAEAIEAAGLDLASLGTKQLDDEIAQAMAAAADLEAKPFVVRGAYVVFNPASAAVREWVGGRTAEMVTAIDENTREAVRQAIADAISTGRHPYDTAQTVKAQVGLTPRQAKAVRNRELQLIADGATEAQAAKVARRYADRLRAQRAENIARTESMTALNRGRYEMRRQMQEDGILPAEQCVEWLTARDERVCPICGPLNGVVVRLGESFSAEVGEAPPAHPQCRCVAVLTDKQPTG